MWKNKRAKCRKVARQSKRRGQYRRDQDSKRGQLEIDQGYVAIILLCSRYGVK